MKEEWNPKYKTVHTIQYQKTKQIIDRRSVQTFLQRRYNNGQQVYKKIPTSLINYERNASQNNNKLLLPHTCQNGYQQKYHK